MSELLTPSDEWRENSSCASIMRSEVADFLASDEKGVEVHWKQLYATADSAQASVRVTAKRFSGVVVVTTNSRDDELMRMWLVRN